MTEQIIEKTKEFVKDSFIKNPKFSFNDWAIMYNHHLIVLDLSLKLAEGIPCDKLVLQLGALLHDIGKAYEADEKTLVEKHAILGWEVSKEFLEKLNLNQEKLRKIKEIWEENKTNTEKKIIEDADTLSFYTDERLQTAFKKWAKERKREDKMQRKIDKFDLLHFEASKKMGLPLLEKFKTHWMKDI